MKSRRIARELAVMILGQLPRGKNRVGRLELEELVARSAHSLIDHARQNLEEATGELKKAGADIVETEVDHPDNARKVESMGPVPVKTDFLQEQLRRIDRALLLISEAIDLPDVTLHAGQSRLEVTCKKCKNVEIVAVDRLDRSEVRDFVVQLVEGYLEHKKHVDGIIRQASSRWRAERMMSIDRDILRLACTELYHFPDVPIRVCINEAVELCHRFADERAAKFINGLLGDLAEHAKRFRQTGEVKALDEAQSGEPVS